MVVRGRKLYHLNTNMVFACADLQPAVRVHRPDVGHDQSVLCARALAVLCGQLDGVAAVRVARRHGHLYADGAAVAVARLSGGGHSVEGPEAYAVGGSVPAVCGALVSVRALLKCFADFRFGQLNVK